MKPLTKEDFENVIKLFVADELNIEDLELLLDKTISALALAKIVWKSNMGFHYHGDSLEVMCEIFNKTLDECFDIQENKSSDYGTGHIKHNKKRSKDVHRKW